MQLLDTGVLRSGLRSDQAQETALTAASARAGFDGSVDPTLSQPHLTYSDQPAEERSRLQRLFE